jgi:hypothetical protein
MSQDSGSRISLAVSVIGLALGVASLFLPTLVPTWPLYVAEGGVACSIALFVGGILPLLPGLRRTAPYLSLREAAGRAYSAARASPSAAFISGYGGDEDQVVYHFFCEMLRLGTPVYGRTPPAEDWIRLSDFDPSGETLFEMRAIKPHHRPIRMTDLSVKRADLPGFIRKLNGDVQ